MYMTGKTNNKILENNIIFTNLIKVGLKKDKTYIFENKGGDFYIAITTTYCKWKIIVNGDEQIEQDNYHLYKFNRKVEYEIKLI